MKTLVLGDVHGCFDEVNIVVARALKAYPDIDAFIQVGDWGDGWPGVRKRFAFSKVYFEELPLQPFYVIEGNHDNFDLLQAKGGFDNPRTIYQSRGSVHDFGMSFGNALFFGGATSPDKDQRIEGVSWWPGESIKYGQVMTALAQPGPIDIVFSHEHPAAFNYKNGKYNNGIGKSDKAALDAIRSHFKPKLWIFGHYHDFEEGETEDTKWMCAPVINSRQAILWDGDNLQHLDLNK